jgi:hypothetical protein
MTAITYGLGLVLLLVILTLLFRHRAFAAGALFAITLAIWAGLVGGAGGFLGLSVVSIAISTAIVARVGLLASAAYWFTYMLAMSFPLTST